MPAAFDARRLRRMSAMVTTNDSASRAGLSAKFAMLCIRPYQSSSMEDTPQIAAAVLGLLDLTRLEDDVDDGPVRALCARAGTRFGHPAAVCVYSHFIGAARDALDQAGLSGQVAIATVANFPDGGSDLKLALLDAEQGITRGADEVDLVFPWRALLDGNEAAGADLVAECKAICGSRTLKVILESGMLTAPDADPHAVRRAGEIAINAGADFLKTSTGKAAAGASPEAARTMLETIRDSGRPVGFKVSGGVRTLADARQYIQIAEDVMGPGWVSPATFRIGASGLLDALLAALEQK